MLEPAYEYCLCDELKARGVSLRRQAELPVNYKGRTLDCGYTMDLVVQNTVVVELKSIEKIAAIHEAQLLTYLRLSGYKVGLLINFNVPILVKGIVLCDSVVR